MRGLILSDFSIAENSLNIHKKTYPMKNLSLLSEIPFFERFILLLSMILIVMLTISIVGTMFSIYRVNKRKGEPNHDNNIGIHTDD